jgi:MFS family permease
LPLYFINLTGTIIALLLAGAFGQRHFMLRSLPWLALSLFGIAISFYVYQYYPLYKEYAQLSVLICLSMSILIFSIGLASSTFTICTEIFPTHLRGFANSITTAVNQQTSYFISAVFLSLLTSSTGKFMTYFGMGIMSLMMFFFVYTYIPETSGKSLDECVEMFR